MSWLLNKYKSLPIKGKNYIILEKKLPYNFKDNNFTIMVMTVLLSLFISCFNKT